MGTRFISLTSQMRNLRCKSVCAWLIITLLGTASALFAETVDDYANQLSHARLFTQPLVWVGTNAPGMQETYELYQAAGLEEPAQGTDKVAAFEAFIRNHANSPWTPSLEANLAVYYRSQGRYSSALQYWKNAWQATKDGSDPKTRSVADYTVAYWSQLLSNLGRVAELKQLITEMNGRPLSTPELERQFNQSRLAATLMKYEPGVAYRCGSLALYHVARAMNVGSNIDELAKMESPDTGFSLSKLMDFSDQYHLGLVAVKRPFGSELVVPSVVHWNENHYAAIVAKRDGAYEVIDPTFGKSKWLSPAAINENCSGYFLVPGKAAPSTWQKVTKEDAATVFGKGLYNSLNPPPAGPPCPPANPVCPTCPTDCPPGGPSGPGGPNGPGGPPGNNSCPSCGREGVGTGMPTWEVQEPYISLWLHDRPMAYNMSFGRQFVLQMDYHQRETRPSDAGLMNFGPDWNSSWLTYIQVGGNVDYNWEAESSYDPTTGNYETNIVLVVSGGFQATEYCPDGGEQDYSWGGTNDDETMNVRTHTQIVPFTVTDNASPVILSGQTFTNFTLAYASNQLVYANGSVATFGQVVTMSEFPESQIALLTSEKDPQGHVMQYSYITTNGNILLSQITDFDGKTNLFLYGNASFPTAVTEITNLAYGLGVNFRYDANGYLTNIVDVMGISSSFVYTETNDEIYFDQDASGVPIDPVASPVTLLTTLQTPYGATTFDYFHPTWPLYTADTNQFVINAYNGLNRAITVTQPDGGKHLFVYEDNYGGFSEIANWPTMYNGGSDMVANEIIFSEETSGNEIWHDNSYYWDPRQYANLSTTIVTNLSDNDLVLGRERNWLHEIYNDDSLSVGQTLSAEQGFSPDGINVGQSIVYGYAGKNLEGNFTELDSTNDDLPCCEGYTTSDDGGSVYFENMVRNSLGYVTQRIEFGQTGQGNFFIKTNLYYYAANQIDLLQHIGPDGIVQETYTYDGNHDVLSFSNALNEVTTYTYNGNEQVTSMSKPNGLVTTNIYNSNGFLAATIDYAVIGGSTVYYRTNAYTYLNGLVSTHTDERSLTTTNAWDALQRLIRVSYPDGTAVSYIYSNLDVVRMVDRMNFTNGFAYDSMRRKVASTNALGRVTYYGYCTCGALESIVDALGNPTSFTYDSAGRLTNTLYADGYWVGRTVDRYGSVVNTTDSSGNSVDSYYDALLHLTAMTNTVGQVAVYNYDVNDLITNQIDANGVSINMAHDNLHRLVSRSYPDGGVERFGYTPDISEVTSLTNQVGDIVLYGYDPMDRKTNEIHVGVTTNKFAYNGAGDLLVLTDGKNDNTTWKYDPFGRVTNKLDNLGTNLFVYQYDADNRLTNRFSAAKGHTVYSYDAVGNLTKVTYPVSPSITLGYDPLNRLTNLVDAVGTTAYGYDDVGQLLSEGGLWPDDTVNYTYANRLRTGLSVAAPNASAWEQGYGYDSARRLTSVISPVGEFDYTYDLVEQQRVDTLTLPGGAVITNGYDDVARMTLTKLLSSQGSNLDSYAYSYNTAGQRTNVVRTAGDFIAYNYDNAGELTNAVAREAAGVIRSDERLSYFYDAAGNLLQKKTSPVLGNQIAYGINGLNQITNSVLGVFSPLLGWVATIPVSGSTTSPATNVAVNGTSAAIYADRSFALNQSVTDGANTFTAIAKDVYGRSSTNASTISVTLSNNAYTYDLNGNLLSDGNRGFAYDDENQLVSVYVTNVWRDDFAYDGKMRRRIERDYSWNGGSWLQTNEVHFIYDGNVVVQERNANNLLLVTYTRGNDLSQTLQEAGGIGGLLARTDNGQMTVGGTFAHALYHADGNGNVTCLVYTNQMIAAKYLYDPYGNTLSQYGLLANANSYRFSSKEWGASSGLYCYLYRFYDPNLQRWINKDPLGDKAGLMFDNGIIMNKVKPIEKALGANLFSFVDNAPIDYEDNFGLFGGAGKGPGPQCMCAKNGGTWEPYYKGANGGKGYDSTMQCANAEFSKFMENNIPAPLHILTPFLWTLWGGFLDQCSNKTCMWPNGSSGLNPPSPK